MYKILSKSSPNALSDIVTVFIKDGWKLAGPLVVRGDGCWFYQPMVKE